MVHQWHFTPAAFTGTAKLFGLPLIANAPPAEYGWLDVTYVLMYTFIALRTVWLSHTQ
jgi:hypothetical protein